MTTSGLNCPPLKVGVVGAGMMGLSHLRIYDTLKGVEIVGVMDADGARARQAAGTYSCPVVESLDEMASRAQAVSVAVPTTEHASTALPLLEAGISCLVEKPLALSRIECEELIAASERSLSLIHI